MRTLSQLLNQLVRHELKAGATPPHVACLSSLKKNKRVHTHTTHAEMSNTIWCICYFHVQHIKRTVYATYPVSFVRSTLRIFLFFKLSQIVDPFGMIVVAFMNSREWIVAHNSCGSTWIWNNNKRTAAAKRKISHIPITLVTLMFPSLLRLRGSRSSFSPIKLIQLDCCASSTAAFGMKGERASFH